MAGEFDDGGPAVVGADGGKEEEEKFRVVMLGERPAAAEESADAELRERVAENGVVLITGSEEDRAVVEGFAGIYAEVVEDSADGFADFGGFAGSGDDLSGRMGDWRNGRRLVAE